METIDPWRGFNQGMQAINGSLAAIQQRKSQGLQDQFQVGQNQQQQMSLADLQAKQGALLQTTGAANLQDAQAQQMEAEKKQQQLAADQKGLEVFGKTMEVLQKSGADAKTMTNFGKEALRQNPRFAPMVDNLTFVDPKGVKAARNFADGELKDPVTGQPLPAGFYETTGQWTGDAANPVKLVSYELKKDPSGAGSKMVERTVDLGDKVEYIYTDGARETKPKGAIPGGPGGMGKPPIGYRYTSNGDLEPIPGGPADQKVTAASKAQEGAVQSIDTAIASASELLTHPGKGSATGLSSVTNILALPGGDAKTFLHKLDTFKSQMFVPMVQQLKGMGQLSDAEGKKLTAAVGALEPSMSDEAFSASLQTIIGELEKTKARTMQPISGATTGRLPAKSTAQPAAKAAFMKRATAAGYSAAEANAHWNKQQGR